MSLSKPNTGSLPALLVLDKIETVTSPGVNTRQSVQLLINPGSTLGAPQSTSGFLLLFKLQPWALCQTASQGRWSILLNKRKLETYHKVSLLQLLILESLMFNN